jgi:N-acetylglucosamine kinase-like BadF-type ATPase
MKAYEEVHFSDQYILRWVREGDEYVNRITKEMMEDFKAVVSQQEKELTEAGCLIGVLREKASQQQDEIVRLKLEWQYMATKLEEYSLLYGAR